MYRVYHIDVQMRLAEQIDISDVTDEAIGRITYLVPEDDTRFGQSLSEGDTVRIRRCKVG